MLHLILALSVFSFSEFKMEHAKNLTLEGYYEESNALLSTIDSKHNTMRDFYKLINAFKSNNKEESLKYLKKVEDSFDILNTRRHQAMFDAMKYELEQWKADDLSDVSRDMRHVVDRLNAAKGGKKTQSIQEDIVRKLNKQIQEKEEKAAADAAAADAKAQQQRSRSSSSGPAQTPQEDSVPGAENGPGNVSEQKLRHYQENWGRLSEKERARVIQELTRDIPPKYRKVVEDYFKSLNKVEQK